MGLRVPDADVPDADSKDSADAPVDAPVDGQACGIDADSHLCDGRDGRAYRWVSIGQQVWMAENLACEASGSHCFNDDPSNCDRYGRLYQWAAAMAGASSSSLSPSGVAGICPSGWHLPSEGEWRALAQAVGATNAGTLLKSVEMGGTDDYGFSVLGAGYALNSGGSPLYAYEGTDANFWTATEVSATGAWHVFFTQGAATLNLADSDTKEFHHSVRCLRD